MKVLSFAVHKLRPRLKFLSTDDDDNNNDAGAMTIVLRNFVTAKLKINRNFNLYKILLPMSCFTKTRLIH